MKFHRSFKKNIFSFHLGGRNIESPNRVIRISSNSYIVRLHKAGYWNPTLYQELSRTLPLSVHRVQNACILSYTTNMSHSALKSWGHTADILGRVMYDARVRLVKDYCYKLKHFILVQTTLHLSSHPIPIFSSFLGQTK